MHSGKPIPSGDVEQYLAELNISRGWMVALIVLLSQAANLFNPHFYSRPILWAGSGVLVAASSLFLLYYMAFYRQNKRDKRRMQVVYRLFWVLICLGMVPYYIKDASVGLLPTNCILICSVMTIVPMFRKEESFSLYMLLATVSLAISLLYGTSVAYNLYVVILCFGGALISINTYRYYIGMIVSLQQQSRTDYMTGLLNRGGGMERLRMVLNLCHRHQRTFALFMVDIDYFKQYNDAFGHSAGDTALITTASCLRSCFGRRADVLCRYGGEEFVAAVSVDEPWSVLLLAHRLCETVEEQHIPAACTKASQYLTVSVGVAVWDPKQNEKEPKLEELIERADRALYGAKRAGRNQVKIFD